MGAQDKNKSDTKKTESQSKLNKKEAKKNSSDKEKGSKTTEGKKEQCICQICTCGWVPA